MIWFAGIARKPSSAALEQSDTILVPEQGWYGQLHGRIRHIHQHVNALPIDPFASNINSDIGLILMIGRHHLDSHARAFGLQTIFNCHLRGQNRAFSC